MRIFQLFLVFIIFFSPLTAQNEPLTSNFLFNDGLYTNFSEFSSNKPSILIDPSKLKYDLIGEENVLILKPESEAMLDSLVSGTAWGICIGQVPYIRTDDKQDNRLYYVKLHVVGKLSYFYYKAFREKEVTMFVHNPYTGERIAKKSITNRDLVFIQRLLHFQTGETIDFNYDNLKAWTTDDKGLSKSLDEMKPEEREGKLFKTLLIYNDRNPVYAGEH
jgi:hypothetical protein